MWSLGCVAAELFLGLPLFPGAGDFDMLLFMKEKLEYDLCSNENVLQSRISSSLTFLQVFNSYLRLPAYEPLLVDSTDAY